MKYLISFNEKFGINYDIKSQVYDFYKEIINNPDKKEFNFIYKNDKGKFPFKVIIGGGLKGSNWGTYKLNFSTEERTIKIQHRVDYATLLHEVKHLDYTTRKTDYYKDIFQMANQRLYNIKSLDPLTNIQNVFYLYNDNEFQSKYHSYYVDFDNFIEMNISKGKVSPKPSPSEIYDLFEKFLMSNRDNSWTWYFKDDEFKFEDYLSNAQINRLFTQFIITDNNDIYSEEYDNLFKFIVVNIKKIWKTKFNYYTKEELANIKKIKNFYEKQVNKRLPKFRKRFLRLVPLMVEKWC